MFNDNMRSHVHTQTDEKTPTFSTPGENKGPWLPYHLCRVKPDVVLVLNIDILD